MSRRRFTKPFNIRVSPEMAAQIRSRAEAEETTPSEIIRRATRAHLEKKRRERKASAS